MPDHKQKGFQDFEIYLGTFFDNEFTWHKVAAYKDFDKAYKAYKAYVNKQLQYTEDELKKVWDTGRLDIELRKGSKLLNWVGIYSREVSLWLEPEKEKAEKEKEKSKENKKDDEESAAKDSALADVRDAIIGQQVVVTRGVDIKMREDREFYEFVNESYNRFKHADWGDLGAEDKAANDASLENNDYMILGNYVKNDYHIYIITDAGGAVTTILFPEEY